mgnify:CR=1 FL=1
MSQQTDIRELRNRALGLGIENANSLPRDRLEERISVMLRVRGEGLARLEFDANRQLVPSVENLRILEVEAVQPKHSLTRADVLEKLQGYRLLIDKFATNTRHWTRYIDTSDGFLRAGGFPIRNQRNEEFIVLKNVSKKFTFSIKRANVILMEKIPKGETDLLGDIAKKLIEKFQRRSDGSGTKFVAIKQDFSVIAKTDSVAELSRVIGVNRGTLGKKFREETGKHKDFFLFRLTPENAKKLKRRARELTEEEIAGGGDIPDNLMNIIDRFYPQSDEEFEAGDDLLLQLLGEAIEEDERTPEPIDRRTNEEKILDIVNQGIRDRVLPVNNPALESFTVAEILDVLLKQGIRQGVSPIENPLIKGYKMGDLIKALMVEEREDSRIDDIKEQVRAMVLDTRGLPELKRKSLGARILSIMETDEIYKSSDIKRILDENDLRFGKTWAQSSITRSLKKLVKDRYIVNIGVFYAKPKVEQPFVIERGHDFRPRASATEPRTIPTMEESRIQQDEDDEKVEEEQEEGSQFRSTLPRREDPEEEKFDPFALLEEEEDEQDDFNRQMEELERLDRLDRGEEQFDQLSDEQFEDFNDDFGEFEEDGF